MDPRVGVVKFINTLNNPVKASVFNGKENNGFYLFRFMFTMPD